MDRYYTIMIIPEREKGVRSIRIPRLVFRSLVFVFVMVVALLFILGFDYWQILQQVYENKHLNIENRQLKEQIQLNQMKINSLAGELSRIHTFEKKLRIITGVESFKQKMQHIPELLEESLEESLKEDSIVPSPAGSKVPTSPRPESSFVFPSKTQENHRMPSQEQAGTYSYQSMVDTDEEDEGNGKEAKNMQEEGAISTPPNMDFVLDLGFEKIEEDPEYIHLKNLYDEKIATGFGLQSSYVFTKEWSELIKRSFALSKQYAKFDFKFNKLKKLANDLEVRVHELDQFLLDKESFIRSTPTLLPTRGWITSYYGPRLSPYSGRIRMHEGLDIGATPGTIVVAPADGIITYAGSKPGFGKLVQIDHGYGVETYFGHNKTIDVRTGQKVKRGEVIAQVGSTGRSTGPHVHYEVRVNGIAVDPLYYILD